MVPTAGRSKQSRSTEIAVRGMMKDEAVTFLKKAGLWDEVRGQTLGIVAERVRPEE